MKKDIIWNSLGTSAWSFASLILLIVVTRVNGIEESGVFSFAFAFAIIMYTVGVYGGRVYQVSDSATHYSTNTYISLRLITSLLGIPLLTLLFILLNQYSLHESVIILALVCQRIFDAIADVFYGIMQKNNQLHLSGISLFYKSILSVVAFTVLDITTHNLFVSSLSLPLLSLAFIIFYDIPRSRSLEKFRVRLNFNGIKNIVASTFLPFSITIMGLIFANIARYFVEIYHPELQGYFGILIMPLSLIILLFSFILVPAILRLTREYQSNDYASLDRSIFRISSSVVLATILGGVATYLAGAPLLKLLFNVDFSLYITDLILVLVVGCSLSITSLFTTIAVIARKLRYTSAVYVLANLVLIILCVLLVDTRQISGAITAYGIASLLQTLAMFLYYLHLTRNYKLSKNL